MHKTAQHQYEHDNYTMNIMSEILCGFITCIKTERKTPLEKCFL